MHARKTFILIVLYTSQLIALGVGWIEVYIVLCGLFSLEPLNPEPSSGQKTLLFQEMDDITF
jgi:hypothetical protein